MGRDYPVNEVLSDQYLLRKNQIYLFGAVDTAMAARVIPQPGQQIPKKYLAGHPMRV